VKRGEKAGPAASINLRQVGVRPIAWEERERWEELMRRHHYLGFHALMGASIRYVAEIGDRWVALLAWSAAALKCRVRDRWIGWAPVIQWQRLHLIANNSRFLILPEGRVAHLASRVLALNGKRLSSDWEAVYGHPIWLAETFVDPTRFAGTCYKAAGWVELGKTRGFGRRGPEYVEHGEPKRVFVRPLQGSSMERLADARPDPELTRRLAKMQLTEQQSDELIELLRRVPEARKARGIRHGRASMLAMAVCAVLCGARSYAAIAEWAGRCSQKLLKRLRARKSPHTDRYEAPSESAIRRLLQAIDVQAVDQALVDWLTRLLTAPQGAVALDGKTLRGARSEEGSQVHLLSAFLHQQGITLAQQRVESKSNEIPAAQPLLQPLDLAEKVVTADALHTQKDLARFLVEAKKAHYLFTVKANQPTLKQDIADLGLTEAFPPSVRNHR